MVYVFLRIIHWPTQNPKKKSSQGCILPDLHVHLTFFEILQGQHTEGGKSLQLVP